MVVKTERERKREREGGANGDILLPAHPGCHGKWLLNERCYCRTHFIVHFVDEGVFYVNIQYVPVHNGTYIRIWDITWRALCYYDDGFFLYGVQYLPLTACQLMLFRHLWEPKDDLSADCTSHTSRAMADQTIWSWCLLHVETFHLVSILIYCTHAPCGLQVERIDPASFLGRMS